MKDKKKILIFSTAYYPFVGGAEVAIKELTDRMPDFDFDLITALLDRDLPRHEKIGNVLVHRVGIGYPIFDKLSLPFWGAIVAAILSRKKNYDYFWCVMVSFASLAAYFFNFFKVKHKIPIILTLQEGDSEEHFRRRWFGLINLMWVFTLKRSSKVTAISSYLKERAKTFGFNGKVHIIPNGVNFSVFRNNFSERDINDTKKKLGFLENDKIIFSASRLVEKNGISDLVKAMAYLSNDFKLVVAGDGEEKENLLELVQKNGLEKRVRFLGFILQRDLPLWMAISFAFVRPSLSEGLGNSFLEAMAMKLPVIGTAVGGISDFLIDGETGLIVTPGNPQSIAAVVLRLHSDNDLRQKIVQKAFSMVKERYDWNNLSISFKMIFDE